MSQLSGVIFVVLLSLHFCSWAYNDIDINTRFQSLSIEQGLSQDAAQAIYQDKRGYLWVGTQEGLNRFDGYTFEVFNHELFNDGALPADWVWSIQEDSSGSLWVATDGGGVARFDEAEHKFVTYQNDENDANSISHNIVRDLFLDNQGRLWIGTENGLNLYRPETTQFETINIAPIPTSGLPNTLKIRAVTEDTTGLLWVGTDGSGLFSFDPKTGNVAHYFAEQADSVLQSNNITSLLIDSDNRLWVGTYNDGVAIINADRSAATFMRADKQQASSLSHNQVRDIFEDSAKTIWLATDNGLDRWVESKQSFAHYRHSPDDATSLTTNKLITIFQDAGNVLWVGTHKGLNKWNMSTASFGHIYKSADSRNSLSDNGVNAFAKSRDGTLWIGTYGGLNAIDHSSGDITHYTASPNNQGEGLSEDRVMSLFADKQDNLWIGTRYSGLDKFNLATESWQHFNTNSKTASRISDDKITKIVPNQKGELLIGTFGGGLNVFDPDTAEFTHYRHDINNPDSISSDKVLDIYVAQDKKIWVGTWEGGITIFNPDMSVYKTVKTGMEPGSLSEDKILTILEDANRNIWLGTLGGGISILRSENRELEEFRFERLGRSQGLPSTTVFGILEDNEGNLWASTNRGMSVINPKSLSVTNYDSADGLQGNDFNSGAYLQSDDGIMYFGGSNGVTVFKPDEIVPNEHVPPTVITEFATINKRSPLSDKLHLLDQIEIDHKDYLVSFSFSALDFAEPENNRYAYKLEGFDRDWLYTNDVRKATYTNLPDGEYEFKVKGANNDGLWNEAGASIKIKVLPPPWATWWAYTLYVLATLLTLLLFVNAYRNKLLRAKLYHQELKNEVSKRTKELTDLNEQLYTANTSDTLSGLKNRIYLLSILEKEVAEINRKIYQKSQEVNYDLAVGPRIFFLMLGLDKFALFNEQNSKECGDLAIREMGQLLSSFFRTTDTVVRWGGDQFLIVGQVDDVRELNRIADRLQQRVKNHSFSNTKGINRSITCSIGFSLYPFYPLEPELLDWQQVQKIATEAMLISKHAGRDTWTGVKENMIILSENDIANIHKNYRTLARDNKITLVEFHSYTKKFFSR